MVAGRTSFYLARPFYDERSADTAIPHVTFLASEVAITVKEINLVSTFLVRAVVGSEHDNRIVGQTFFFQVCYQITYLLIDNLHHLRKAFFHFRPVFSSNIRIVRRNLTSVRSSLVVGMRQIQCIINEERVLLIV